jgi:two-component system, cell cycle response regulator
MTDPAPLTPPLTPSRSTPRSTLAPAGDIASTPYRPIASQLIRSTVILAMVCMAGVFVVQTMLAVQQDSKQYQLAVDDIARNSVPLLSLSLWDIEPNTVQHQVDLIAQHPQIAYAQVIANVGRQFFAGDPALKGGPVSLRINIPAPAGSGAGNATVGELSLVGNQRFLMEAVLRNALSVLLGYGIFTALICGLIAYILRRELQNPLQHMAQFASQLTPQTLTQPLDLDRPKRANVDEIDLVADGFSTLQQGLRGHIKDLDFKVEERTAQLKALAETNRLLSITDELTGCFNRRTLESRLQEELGRSKRYRRSLSIICLDLDSFKHINDAYGHAAGDEVLRRVGRLLRHSTRQNLDWIVRMGGEEFLIVQPETELASAQAHADRLRKKIAGQPVLHNGREIHVTASLGVAQWQPPEDGQALIMRADALLYSAKEAGRNLVYPPVSGLADLA